MSAKLTPRERADLARLEGTIHAGIHIFHQVGRALDEIRRRELHKETHDRFEDYAVQKWGFSEQHAYRLIGAAGVADDLADSPNGLVPSNERQARPLAPLPPEERRAAWATACERAGGQPSEADVRESVEELAAEALAALPREERLAHLREMEVRSARRAEDRQRRDATGGVAHRLEAIRHHLRQARRHAVALGGDLGAGVVAGVDAAEAARAALEEEAAEAA